MDANICGACQDELVVKMHSIICDCVIPVMSYARDL